LVSSDMLTMEHYRSFIGQLEQKGVDLSHVKIAKSVLVSLHLFAPPCIRLLPAIKLLYALQAFLPKPNHADKQTLWGLSKYSHFTKTNKDLASKFKAALHLPHSQTEQEKSDDVEKNADREEVDHQERIRKVREVEKEPAGDGKEEKVRQALFGDDGLTNGKQVEGNLASGEGEEKVREAVEEEEGREKKRDQTGVQVS
jgi:hypothetical protein